MVRRTAQLMPSCAPRCCTSLRPIPNCGYCWPSDWKPMHPQIDLALALDPARLFRRAVGSEPDPWQAQLLRSDARQILLNCTRQAGKSTSTAALALHTALYQPGALILILAPALRQ